MQHVEAGVAELRTPVVILGAGGYASVIAEILSKRADVLLLGATDKALGLSERAHDDQPRLRILGDDDQLPVLAEEHAGLHAILALGMDLMDVRARLIQSLQRQGIPSINAIHPNAIVSEDTQLGAGTVVRAAAVLSSESQIGRHCVLELACSLDHHVTLGTNVYIGQGAHVASYVEIRDNVVLEMGAQINRRVVVGQGARITGGSFVNTDVPDYAVVVGVPGRVVRYVET